MKEKKKTGYIGKKEELNENGICRNVWVDGRYIEKKKKRGKENRISMNVLVGETRQ